MFFQLIGHKLLVLRYSKKFSLTANPNKYTDTKRHSMIYSNFLAVKMRHRNIRSIQKIEKINELFDNDAFICLIIFSRNDSAIFCVYLSTSKVGCPVTKRSMSGNCVITASQQSKVFGDTIKVVAISTI